MPNINRDQTVYLTTGNPDTLNDSSLYAGGELGVAFDYNNRAYQIVQCDSGATAALASGVVAAKQLAYWKDKTKFVVTNSLINAQGGTTEGRNMVAGIFRTAVTAGNFCTVLQRGDNINIKSDGNGAAGDSAIANSGNNADLTNVTAGTAPGYVRVGVVRGASAGGNINVDLDIPNIP